MPGMRCTAEVAAGDGADSLVAIAPATLPSTVVRLQVPKRGHRVCRAARIVSSWAAGKEVRSFTILLANGATGTKSAWDMTSIRRGWHLRTASTSMRRNCSGWVWPIRLSSKRSRLFPITMGNSAGAGGCGGSIAPKATRSPDQSYQGAADGSGEVSYGGGGTPLKGGSSWVRKRPAGSRYGGQRDRQSRPHVTT